MNYKNASIFSIYDCLCTLTLQITPKQCSVESNCHGTDPDWQHIKA